MGIDLRDLPLSFLVLDQRASPRLPAGATRVIGAPIKLSETPASLRSAPPVLGQHTDAVLAELGYSAVEIAGLRDGSVI